MYNFLVVSGFRCCRFTGVYEGCIDLFCLGFRAFGHLGHSGSEDLRSRLGACMVQGLLGSISEMTQQ